MRVVVRSRGWRVFSTLVVILVSGTARAGAGQRTGGRSLVWQAWQSIGATATAADGGRTSAVSVHFDQLAQAAASGGSIELPLTDGLTVRASVTWAQSDASQTLVAGPLMDGLEGEAALTVVGDSLVARVVVNGRLFMVRRAPDSSIHVVAEIHQDAFPPELQPLSPPVPRSAAGAPPFEQGGQYDTNQFVDVMIVYTPAARAQAGGTSQIVAELTGAVNNANLALSNAGVTHRFRLVHYEEVAYTETNDSNTDLSRLQAVGDGFLDNVHTLRDAYRADTVTLLTTDGDACGLGYLMGPSSINSSFAPYAFNVVLWSCANANLSFAHETGHNMGLNHDRANASGSPAFSYAYGYAVPGVARDVMSYPCSNPCPRLAIYSTPLYNFPGTSTAAGTATEDNARALNNTSLAVANFRQSIQPPPSQKPVGNDYDGDKKADIVVYRPSNGGWWFLRSSTSNTAYSTFSWGLQGDVPVPGDYDGDGKTDLAIYRPSTATWWILWSSTNYTTYSTYAWGLGGDVPVPADYDGDGKTDIAIYRPSTAGWWILKSSSNFTTYFTQGWGLGGADTPVPADYDGDGKADIAIYRPSTAGWWILWSSTNYSTYSTYGWGLGGDIPIPADYDGDGKADIAIYRPSSSEWWILRSSSNFGAYVTYTWGSGGDVPVAADYDGDGKVELTTYRPSAEIWSVLWSSTGYSSSTTYGWGLSGDVPLPAHP